MLRTYHIENNRFYESAEGGCPILLFIAPDEAERRLLTGTYLVDEHTLSSALDPDEVSRLEYEPDHLAVILKRPCNYSSADDLLFKVSSVGVFVYADKMIIVMAEEIPIFEYNPKHLMKIGDLKDALLKIILGTISHFLAHLRIINQISEAIEQKINTSMENKYLLNMFTLQKSLVYYLNGISYNAALFEKLKNASSKLGFNGEQIETLDDIIIENSQCLKQAEIYTNILSSLMDARASIVNNNLSLLIKRLTVINIVFLPITFIASVGGMSEYTALMEGVPMWLSYLLFSVAMTILAFATYLVVKRINYEKPPRGGRAQKKRGKRD